jgi:hypothetical protein
MDKLPELEFQLLTVGLEAVWQALAFATHEQHLVLPTAVLQREKLLTETRFEAGDHHKDRVALHFPDAVCDIL